MLGSSVQISCVSSSDELGDGIRFPYYFQLLPSEVNLAHVFYSIIKEYGWRRVALIVQNEHRYKTVCILVKIYLIILYVNSAVENVLIQMITALKHMLLISEDSRPIAYFETVIDYESDIVASDKNVFVSGVKTSYVDSCIISVYAYRIPSQEYLSLLQAQDLQDNSCAR